MCRTLVKIELVFGIELAIRLNHVRVRSYNFAARTGISVTFVSMLICFFHWQKYGTLKSASTRKGGDAN